MSLYRCPNCNREYIPQEAAARSYFCCGQPLERVGSGASPPDVAAPEAAREVRRSLEALLHPAGLGREIDVFARDEADTPITVEVISPAGNTVDALAMEGLLGSLGLHIPFALEIAADGAGRHFVVRARKGALSHLCSQMESVYGQVGVRERPLIPPSSPGNGSPMQGA
jgi:hypothetical protein